MAKFTSKTTRIQGKEARRIAAGVILLILLGLTAYREVLRYYFTSIDSFPLILVGKIESFKDIGKIFSSPLGGGFPFGSYYRPVSELSYGIDYLVWGMNPMGYHITDLILHLGNSILIFFASGTLFKKHPKGLLCAWIGSMLFLLSPINMSIITTMERRQDMLMALFFALSLLAFSKVERSAGNRVGWYLLSLVFGFLAIFSKESAFVLPVLVCLLSFVLNDNNEYTQRAFKAVKLSLPFFGFTLLNTLLHMYFFGHWNVHVSSGVSQRIVAAVKSFFTLAGPFEVLELSLFSKAIVFFIISLCFLIIILWALIKLGIRGFLDCVLKEELKLYTYLVCFILTFTALFAARGTSHDFYHYLPNMALTILVALLLVDTFNNRIISIMVKTAGSLFVIYTVTYSPVFTDYSAWRNSSDITRQVIDETEKLLTSDPDASQIYLINWPGFIGSESDVPGTNSTILVSYSMTAWADLAGFREARDIRFVHISYASFPAGDLNAILKYDVSEKKINIAVKGCCIAPSKIPYNGDSPFVFSVNEDGTKGEIVFTRPLQDNERLFLYEIGQVKMIGGNS